MDKIIQAIDAEISRLEAARTLLAGDIEASGKRASSARGSDSVQPHRKKRARRGMEAAYQADHAKPGAPTARSSKVTSMAGDKEQLKEKLLKLIGNSEMSRTNLNNAFRTHERSLLKPILTKLLEEGVLTVRFDGGKTGRAKAMISVSGATGTVNAATSAKGFKAS
jgi:hypothetical protein